MNFFSLLWVPIFYLFWRTSASGEGGEEVWALFWGSLAALLQFLGGGLVDPGGFGFSRWLSGFVDIVCLPALLPFVLYLLCLPFGFFHGHVNLAQFALLWLIPEAAFRSISWSALGSPVLLILPPLLWTAIAVGIPFLADCIQSCFRRRLFVVCAICAIAAAALPIAAATSWWAFYVQRILPGFILLAVSFFPLLASLVHTIIKRSREQKSLAIPNLNGE